MRIKKANWIEIEMDLQHYVEMQQVTNHSILVNQKAFQVEIQKVYSNQNSIIL